MFVVTLDKIVGPTKLPCSYPGTFLSSKNQYSKLDLEAYCYETTKKTAVMNKLLKLKPQYTKIEN
jgi:hypothetical protein